MPLSRDIIENAILLFNVQNAEGSLSAVTRHHATRRSYFNILKREFFFNLFFDCIIVKERQILNAVNEPDFAEGGSGGVLSFIISLIRSFSLFFFVFLTF